MLVEQTCEEHIENIIGNMWEDNRNMVGIQKIKKSMLTNPFPQGKKVSTLKCMFNYFIGCTQILFLKLVVMTFGLN